MGLASSQARLLNLTSRMHQIEYKAAKIEAEKLQMANESRRVYLEYQEALEQSKIQIKTIQTDASATYVDITSYKQMFDSGYALVFHGDEGDVVCIAPVDQNGDTSGATAQASFVELIKAVNKKYHPAPTGQTSNPNALPTTEPGLSKIDFKTLLINLMNMGDISIVQKRTKDVTDAQGHSYTRGSWPGADDFDYSDWISSVATNTSFQEVDDEKALRKAEAKYEADMRRIDMKDRKFDYDLAALDAERNAVKQEMETLKTVAKDNVDRTFKLFS